MKKLLGNHYGNEYTPLDAGAETGPVTIIENTAAHVDTEDARQEYVTECNACSYYNRGECGRTGLESHPDDYCSRAVPAEA